MAWLWLACVAVAPGQEPQQPNTLKQQPRVPQPGEVVRSISIRVTDGQPRFVVAARVVEEADEREPHAQLADGDNALVSLEASPEIVDYFKRTAQQRIAEIDRLCELSEQQKTKLELAAMGDMSRLVRESRGVRHKYSGVALHNEHRALAVFEDVAEINTHLSQGVLREGSMFLMVLKSLLSPAQLSQLASAKFAELTTAWPIEMSADQRQQLWHLMLRTHARDARPLLLWFPKPCRPLVAQLPRPELVVILGESSADTLVDWCRH